MSSKQTEKILQYTEYLQSKGYVVKSGNSEPQGVNDCEFGGDYFAEGSRICIDGDCKRCSKRRWISTGNACPGSNGSNC